MSDGLAKLLYDRLEIDGKIVMVFLCGKPPLNADFLENNGVFYEASDMTVKWFKSPFYISKNPPSFEELEFQLRKWHSERQTKLIIAAVICSFIFLYFLNSGDYSVSDCEADPQCAYEVCLETKEFMVSQVGYNMECKIP